MSLQKQTMTMDQLLEQLITKAKLEAEEAHRGYIAALNGLAGIDIIEVMFHKYFSFQQLFLCMKSAVLDIFSLLPLTAP